VWTPGAQGTGFSTESMRPSPNYFGYSTCLRLFDELCLIKETLYQVSLTFMFVRRQYVLVDVRARPSPSHAVVVVVDGFNKRRERERERERERRQQGAIRAGCKMRKCGSAINDKTRQQVIGLGLDLGIGLI